MPTYDYHCPTNNQIVEVMHSINQELTTWGELCQQAGIETGETPSQSAIKRVISAPGLAFPKTNAELKNLGFTKLVKREKGVYENVTATKNESRYVRSDDPSSAPDLKSKIRD